MELLSLVGSETMNSASTTFKNIVDDVVRFVTNCTFDV